MSKNIKRHRHRDGVFEKFGMIWFDILVDGVRKKAFTTMEMAKNASTGFPKPIAYFVSSAGIIETIHSTTNAGKQIAEMFKE